MKKEGTNKRLNSESLPGSSSSKQLGFTIEEGTSSNEFVVVNSWNGRPYSQRYHNLLEKRRTLPVWGIKELLLKDLIDNQTMIVSGYNCVGKTTQIPQFLLELHHHDDQKKKKKKKKKMMVACTQPRPMSAKSVSCRVAEEMDVTIGKEVGYSIPMEEDCSCAKTVLKYLTHDMLLREARTDPLFKRYNVIILDEAQERTLATDILLAYLKQFVLEHRPDLKLVVMCSTDNSALDFPRYFPDATLMAVAEKYHPVEIFYEKEELDEQRRGYLEEAIMTTLFIHLSQGPGDILVFLAVEEEDIEHVCMGIIKQLERFPETTVGHPLTVVPLYSTSPPDMLQKIYEEGRPRGRKVVVTTDIAETSQTIDGIVYVVDSGYAKRKVYNHQIHAESMQVLPISMASAYERANLAGRTQPGGKCYRLYTAMRFESFEKQHTYPEILRSNLANTVLALKKLGVDDPVQFEFMDPPAPKALIRAQHVLNCLGALDSEGNLTALGEIMSEFPLDPQMSKMLVVSPGFNCSNEILTISAMLSVPDCFVRPRESEEAADEAKARFSHIDGDHIGLLNVYNAYKQNHEDPSWCNNNFINARVLESADSLRQHLMHIMSRLQLKLCSADFSNRDYYGNIRKAMLAGYFMQVAHLDRSGHYLTVKDNLKVILHPSSCLDHKPQWVIYNEYILTSRCFIRTVTAIDGEWLVEIAPHYYAPENFPQCEAKRVLESLHKRVLESLHKMVIEV